jgi:uncharacterized protein YecT (DUF1311 family)
MALSMLVARSACADQAEEIAELERTRVACVRDGNQTQLNFCAAADYYEVDLELNRIYSEQMRRLSEPNRSRLREAQKAWIEFRDKACLYEAGPREESGSIWPLSHFGCLTAHTRQRMEDLKGYLSCTQDGCPN